MNVRFDRSGPLRGQLRPPPDKSISHRAAMIAAMAAEPVRVTNYLRAEDTRSTLDAVRRLGAIVNESGDELVIRGCGLRHAQTPQETIDVGNAGTLMRVLPGWLSFQLGSTFTLDGDASIRRRPIDRIAAPLRMMGARLDARCAAWAPRSTPPTTGCRRSPCTAPGCARSPTSCRSPAPRSSRACCSPAWSPMPRP
jgi:3-phosphoshikimate 1-carboxyvinyltransferase